MRVRSGSAAVARVLLLATIALAAPARGVACGTDDARLAAEIARLLDVGPGSTVAEVGAGHGEMAVHMVVQVGATGHVYATEIDPVLVAEIRDRATRGELTNLRVETATAHVTGLPAECCDAAYMIGVYHHLTDPAATDRSLFAALKPGGRLLVDDFPPTLWLWPWTPKGIPANRGGHGVPDHIVIEELRAAGFELVRELKPWHAGLFIKSYGLVFRKPRK